MADIIIATMLVLGGFAWAFLNYAAASMHPAPSQTSMGAHIVVGLLIMLAGLLYWAVLIFGWLI